MVIVPLPMRIGKYSKIVGTFERKKIPGEIHGGILRKCIYRQSWVLSTWPFQDEGNYKEIYLSNAFLVISGKLSKGAQVQQFNTVKST